MSPASASLIPQITPACTVVSEPVKQESWLSPSKCFIVILLLCQVKARHCFGYNLAVSEVCICAQVYYQLIALNDSVMGSPSGSKWIHILVCILYAYVFCTYFCRCILECILNTGGRAQSSCYRDFLTEIAMVILRVYAGTNALEWYRLRLRSYGSWDRIPPGYRVVVF
jgi:hypothetical protein